jgi:general secretion pathway protein I
VGESAGPWNGGAPIGRRCRRLAKIGPTALASPLGACRLGGHRSGGFSLLEVLVAFTILALTLGVLMQVFSGSINGTRNSEEYQEAAALAESVLALVGADIPLEPGSQGGELNGFVWRTEISESPAAELVAPPEDLIPNLVRVRVEWASGGRTRDLELVTLRLAQPPR